MATRSRRPEPSTAETDALKVELRQLDVAWRARMDADHAAFKALWDAKMHGIAPTEPPPVIRVTWSLGRAR